MQDVRHIQQAKRGYRREFMFEDAELICRLHDPLTERNFSVPYEAVDLSSQSTLVVKRISLGDRLVLLALFVAIQAVVSSFADKHDQTVKTICAIAILACAVAVMRYGARWFSVKFTLIKVSPPPPGSTGALMIIHDRYHDTVIDTLRGRWNARMKKLYGRADLNADPVRETARLAWLRDRGVIDGVEYLQEISRLTMPPLAAPPSS